MGYLQAIELASGIDGLVPNRSDQLRLHLTGNHYPPVPVEMVPVCEEAIDKALADEFDHLIELPEGFKFQNSSSASVADIVEGLHLHPWLEIGFIDDDE